MGGNDKGLLSYSAIPRLGEDEDDGVASGQPGAVAAFRKALSPHLFAEGWPKLGDLAGAAPRLLIAQGACTVGLRASSQWGLAMMKRAAFIALMLLCPTIAFAGENPVLGTWKLKSWVREIVGTGEKINPMGERPNGYLNYSADGRMYAILTADNRLKPEAANPTDEQRVKLHQSMSAYAGTYTIEGDKVTHHVDISWNEGWTGTKQVRFFKLDGNILTITTAVGKNPDDGRESRGVLVWEMVKGPAQ
jgi:hypothetical protein